MFVDYKQYDWYKAFLYSAYKLEKYLFNTDLSSINKLEIPVYFILERNDWNIPTSVTLDYFQKLLCPKKDIIWLEKSGHEPLSEEPNKFN